MVETKTLFRDNSAREMNGSASQHGRSSAETIISATNRAERLIGP